MKSEQFSFQCLALWSWVFNKSMIVPRVRSKSNETKTKERTAVLLPAQVRFLNSFKGVHRSLHSHNSLVETFVNEISPGFQLELSSSRDIYFEIFSREAPTHSSKPFTVIIEQSEIFLISLLDWFIEKSPILDEWIEESVMSTYWFRGRNEYNSK